MELHQLRYFLAVCETLNFTRAAENCHVSQPALTRAIKKLEEELGGPLFRRERARSHLTELGRLMRPHLERSLAALEAAKNQAEDLQSLDHAPLGLGVMCTIGPNRLVSLMARLQSDIPGLDLSLQEGKLTELTERLLAGDLEVALLASPEELPERLDFIPLYRERFVLAFPPGHRFAERNAVRIRDLHEESYLLRLNCEYTAHIVSLLRERGAQTNIRYRSEREDWIQSMVLAGMGSSFMPEFLPIYAGLPTRVVIEPKVSREVGLATIAGRRYSPAVAAFVRLARSHEWGA